MIEFNGKAFFTPLEVSYFLQDFLPLITVEDKAREHLDDKNLILSDSRGQTIFISREVVSCIAKETGKGESFIANVNATIDSFLRLVKL